MLIGEFASAEKLYYVQISPDAGDFSTTDARDAWKVEATGLGPHVSRALAFILTARCRVWRVASNRGMLEDCLVISVRIHG
jgi:hypothetical protein